MATSSWTQDDLDKINKLIASGVKSVSFMGRQVNYGDLIQIRKEIMADIARSTVNNSIKYRTAVYMRGL